MRPPYTLYAGEGLFRPGVDGEVFLRTFEGREGTHAVPYIQSSNDVSFRVEFVDVELETIELELIKDGEIVAEADLTPDNESVNVMALDDGEYEIVLRGFDEKEEGLFEHHLAPLGIGDTIAMIGDSLTEGYYGNAWRAKTNDLTAQMFPPESVSSDGRNYPQFAPTAFKHWPEVNAMQGCLTDLNNLLTAAFQHPVFISNEGWGGITSEQFLTMMRTDRDWEFRMRELSPSLWLIHLGANDLLAKVPSKKLIENMQAITDILRRDYGAAPEDICIALPSYNTGEGLPEGNAAYADALRTFIAENGFLLGPDFHTIFSTAHAQYYKDFIHPTPEGMPFMAECWRDALVAALQELGDELDMGASLSMTDDDACQCGASCDDDDSDEDDSFEDDGDEDASDFDDEDDSMEREDA